MVVTLTDRERERYEEAKAGAGGCCDNYEALAHSVSFDVNPSIHIPSAGHVYVCELLYGPALRDWSIDFDDDEAGKRKRFLEICQEVISDRKEKRDE